MSEQEATQASTLQHPAHDDPEAWKAYWKKQGQRWRTEPEVDAERQMYLAGRRAITPDIEQGVYPFKETKLSRADVEWLLATHENGRGPVDWGDERQHEREGLDLRGANMRGVNLARLPLARMLGALGWQEWPIRTQEQREMAAVLLEQANLNGVHLEGADLSWAHLEEADLFEARLQDANLQGTHLEKARLNRAQLKGAHLFKAVLRGANLSWAHLEGADLSWAHLEGTLLKGAVLEETDLEKVTMSDEKQIGPRLADIHWGETNLTVVKWAQIKMSGDEYEASQKKKPDGKKKGRDARLDEYEQAVRANRQLAVVLREQGINEEADRFAYRGQVLQRKMFWFQMVGHQVKFRQRVQSVGNWLFSWFLNLFTGYGFKPGRWLIIYLGTIAVFGVLHYFVGMPHSTLLSALGTSVLNLHGRPFLNPPSGAEGGIDIAEAFVGLVIEAVLVAIITQRILGK